MEKEVVALKMDSMYLLLFTGFAEQKQCLSAAYRGTAEQLSPKEVQLHIHFPSIESYEHCIFAVYDPQYLQKCA